MKIIECLNDKISEELSDSESYANLALKYKESDKETAKLFYDLSLEETKHYNKLHDRVVAVLLLRHQDDHHRAESADSRSDPVPVSG